MDTRTWTDQDLVRAVEESTTWMGVIRSLGLKSSSSIDTARKYARRLGLDTSHVHGQIKYAWTATALRAAIEGANDWEEVTDSLGMEDTSKARAKIRGYAARKGVEFSHLDGEHGRQGSMDWSSGPKARSNLRMAAPSIATAWFVLQGLAVAVPHEPMVYDLLVTFPSGVARVQVKSTTRRVRGKWIVGVGRRPYSLDKTAGKAPYDPDLLDYFFIVDGDGALYLIPASVIAGMVSITVSAYQEYRVGSVTTLVNGEAA